jgi:hypothetical protein
VFSLSQGSLPVAAGGCLQLAAADIRQQPNRLRPLHCCFRTAHSLSLPDACLERAGCWHRSPQHKSIIFICILLHVFSLLQDSLPVAVGGCLQLAAADMGNTSSFSYIALLLLLLPPQGSLPVAAGGCLQLAAADISQRQTLSADMFDGVRSVVSCTAVKVQPKEGDTVDRQKYYQVCFFNGVYQH